MSDYTQEDWERDEAENLKRIEALEAEGHSSHCACRQVWGDGCCECEEYAKGYNPYEWMEL